VVTLQDEEEDEEEAWPQAKARSPLMRAEYAWLSAARRGEQSEHGSHVVVGCQSGVGALHASQEALGGATQAAICRHIQRLPASHCLKMRQKECDLSATCQMSCFVQSAPTRSHRCTRRRGTRWRLEAQTTLGKWSPRQVRAFQQL